MKKFVDVIIPLPIASQYTYSLPEGMEASIQPGCRIIVPFGPKKFYTGIVTKVHETAPEAYETKDISEVLDSRPVLLGQQFSFWKWLADYYLCTLGDVYKAALPSGMKLESETLVEYNPDFVASEPLPPREQRILDLLSADPEQCVTQLEKASGMKNLLPVIKSLLEKEAICIKEEIKRSYKPRTEVRVRLTEALQNEHHLHIQFDLLARAPKQQAILMKYLELSGWNAEGKNIREVSKKELLDASGQAQSVFKNLVDKQILETYLHEIGRLTGDHAETVPLHTLSPAQQRAFYEILTSFQTKNVCLLHGVTASGKTEIYIHLIEEVLKAGKQVLYLLPEIALTTQITERLRRVFGKRLGVYHSKFPDAERVEIWQKQLTEQGYDVILGVRSSVFLPFRRLGLVIVDEEHETSYKQQDPAPRYHARNAAIMLASMYGAKTLLGTATPSLESYYHARNGKYGLVELTERHQQIQLPHIELVDIKELARKKRMTAQFSPLLLQKIREALEQKEQVILFQNRRGFAPMIECRTCGWVPKCENCDVSLTFHKNMNMLTCHYCGFTYSVPKKCPNCEGEDLRPYGYGTEKIEEKIMELFPNVPVARMDLDTTRSRNAYERIINDFSAGRTKILIGTQMVSKGLDFDHVRVVGILNADSMLNVPDFRAYEHAFTMMSQVAGRAGRKGDRGLVILQTKDVEQPIIEQVVTNNWRAFYSQLMAERRLFHYPPFYRLIYVYLKHKDDDRVNTAAIEMGGRLRQWLGARVLGPDKPAVSKVRTFFIRKIMLKLEPGIDMKRVRQCLLLAQRQMEQDKRYSSLQIYYDVDPS